MSSALTPALKMEDPSRLHKIDRLMEIGVGEYIPLPQLVVVGDQSSGKSSVLEALTGLPFPRDSTLCTRFATQIVFRRAEKEAISISIIPAASSSAEREQKLRAFRADELTSLSAAEFAKVLSQACTAMGLPTPGSPRAPGQSTFSDNVFRIELCGPTQQHLSVIDIPGIYRNETEGITAKGDKELVRDMVHRFIDNPRSIILAVLPANVDVATQEILDMAADVDPSGQRTLGVLTKPDLVDKGAEKDVMDLVQGKRKPMRLGYCMLRNRGQKDLGCSSSQRNREEKEFFSTGPFSPLTKDRVGIAALHLRLRSLLSEITRREFPNVKREIVQLMEKCKDDLCRMGPSRETKEQQRKFLLDTSVNFQETVAAALDARYGRNEYLGNSDNLRLATKLVDLNMSFAENVANEGQTVRFDSKELGPEPAPALQSNAKAATSLPTNPGPASSVETGIDYPEIDDIVPRGARVPSGNFDIFKWIERRYKSSRGFELGTFDPAILPTLFREQTSNWEYLAMLYIRKVIHSVHQFCDELLGLLIIEEPVKAALWDQLQEALLPRYQQMVSHVLFVLATERRGTLLTENDYFIQTLEKRRLDRLKKMLEAHAEEWHSGDKMLIKLDTLTLPAGMSNVDHTVRDIHDILEAYYKVAQKRFVDVVCTQGTDRHIVSGKDSPLRVFSPAYVLGLTDGQLETIAGEEESSVQRRKTLEKEIESLAKAKTVLLG
ncbi:MAG: hypothetical protein M1817_005466 [Caeruleum heppii]|nr:MAG: hypothetical protein M1817_005466 [Caeruleum heppii]